MSVAQSHAHVQVGDRTFCVPHWVCFALHCYMGIFGAAAAARKAIFEAAL